MRKKSTHTESWQSVWWWDCLYISMYRKRVDRMIYWHKLAHLLFRLTWWLQQQVTIAVVYNDHESLDRTFTGERMNESKQAIDCWNDRVSYKKEHKYIGVISFFLLTNKCKMIDILYTTIYIFPAEQPDKDKIGHCMFIHILNKYYAFIVIIGLAYSFWWVIYIFFMKKIISVSFSYILL